MDLCDICDKCTGGEQVKSIHNIRHKMLKTFGIHVVLYCLLLHSFSCLISTLAMWLLLLLLLLLLAYIDENSAAFVCITYKWNLFIFSDSTERRARIKQQLQLQQCKNRISLTTIRSFARIKRAWRGGGKEIEWERASIFKLHGLSLFFGH